MVTAGLRRGPGQVNSWAERARFEVLSSEFLVRSSEHFSLQPSAFGPRLSRDASQSFP